MPWRWPALAPAFVVNDLGGSVDGKGGSEAAQQVVDEIKAKGGEAVASYDSVATPEGGAAIVKTAVDSFVKVDVVINNAGILRDKSSLKMSWEDLDLVLDVHLRGAFYVSQPAGVRGDEGERLRPLRLHLLQLRGVWQLRPDQLRRSQVGPRRALQRPPWRARRPASRAT